MQQWVKYTEWEEWLNGMWRTLDRIEEPKFLHLAIEFTGDHVAYGLAMHRAAYEWPRTMLNSLTNPSINRRAFLGHCACQLQHNIPEYITRQAWRMLTEKQRIDADLVAQKTIDEWIEKYLLTLKRGNKDVTRKEYPMNLQLKF